MRPSARVQAAIEVLEAVEAGIASLGLPADSVLASYCRQRRYIGSKDRRAIAVLVYGVIRSRAQQMWRLKNTGLAITARTQVISYLFASDPESLSVFGDDSPHAPAAFSRDEQHAVDHAFARLKPGEVPHTVKLELPAWLLDDMVSRFGVDYADALEALNAEAPFDLRLNPFKVSGDVNNLLNIADQSIEKTKYSPVGCRAFKRINIQDTAPYRSGEIEVQDEAAQLACYLVAVAPDMQIVDLCAGAGGKSLLLSALMRNQGNIHACDISGKRLRELEKRASRAGCTNIKTTTLPVSGAARDRTIAHLTDTADRVVVDAPCSGTGTWRRNPDQRWRLSPALIREYSATQQQLLAEGAMLVKPGGRLVYMTCSWLEAENEHVVSAFLDAHAGAWTALPFSDIWADVLLAPAPETLSANPAFLQLAPHLHQTDGFFVAILEKR